MLSATEIDALAARYEAMAVAARAQDWERLVALDADVAELCEKMRSASRVEAAATVPATMSEAEVRALATRIEHILALDAEIRAETEPYLDSLRRLLAGLAKDRALKQLYGR